MISANIRKNYRWCYGPFEKKESKEFLTHARSQVTFGSLAIHEIEKSSGKYYITVPTPKRDSESGSKSSQLKNAFEHASNQMGLNFSNSNVVDNQGLFFDPEANTDNTDLGVIFG